MASSASTPGPSAERPIRLLLRVAGEDHPKACTGRRLLRRGLAEREGTGPRGRAPILLDPHALQPLSRADLPRARSGGVLGVDCSWNRLDRRGGYPTAARRGPEGPRRRLPFLLAGNPQHYGRVAELNTAEALASALWVLGESARARSILEGFPGGTGFVSLNAELLARYDRCADAEEIRSAEREFF